jgi:Mlc titration factor MtfA (ptsG expression regulator)
MPHVNFLNAQGESQIALLLVILVFIGVIFLAIRVLISLGGFVINNSVAAWERLFYTITKREFHLYTPVPKYALPHTERQFLFDQLHFYKQLTPVQRRAFDNRVVQFMRTRSFLPRGGVELTVEMRLLISAIAVKITFGMRSYMMKEFTRIVVYPKAYYNRESKSYHKGEVNANGIVVLSWEDFYEGIRVPDDNLNLGLHEFAHVLALQRLSNPLFYDHYFKKSFDRLMQTTNNKMIRVAIGQRLGLRKYAYTNAMEFFAVATEAFFENPEAMYRANPSVYGLFAKMYNLDLLRMYDDTIQPLAK